MNTFDKIFNNRNMFSTLFITVLSLCIAYQSPLIGFLFLVSVYMIFYPAIYHLKNYPPGPTFGFLPFLHGNPVEALTKLSKVYGNVYSLHIGGHHVVVLNDYEIVKKYINKPEFLSRSDLIPADFFPGKGGFSALHGKIWQEQRSRVTSMFKDLESGSSPIEKTIQKEAHDYVEYLERLKGMPIYDSTKLWSGINNIITALVLGEPLQKEDSERNLIDQLVTVGSLISRQISFYGFMFPNFRDFLYRLIHDPFNKQISIIKSGVQIIYRSIKRRIENNQIEKCTHSFLFLNNTEARNLVNIKEESVLFDSELVGNILLLYLAGTETTKSSINWLLLITALNPEIQARIHEEIDSHFERDYIPQWADRFKLPYTMAVIQEAQRWKPILPLGVLRRTEEDTSIEGYFVPKHSTIMTNLYAIHHDPTYWKEPSVFNPERHLSEDGKTTIKPVGYMPFSYGRRNCPGMALAYVEIFIYFTSILQRFRVCQMLKESFFLKGPQIFPTDPMLSLIRFSKRT